MIGLFLYTSLLQSFFAGLPEPDWLSWAERFGIPMLILIALGWFGVRHVWPFITKQVERWQRDQAEQRDKFLSALSANKDEREAERKAFLEALAAQNVIIREHTQKFGEMVDALNSMAAMIAEVNEKMEAAPKPHRRLKPRIR